MDRYYINFDSSRRDRSLYPNPCSFSISQNVNNVIYDEVCEGLPVKKIIITDASLVSTDNRILNIEFMGYTGDVLRRNDYYNYCVTCLVNGNYEENVIKNIRYATKYESVASVGVPLFILFENNLSGVPSAIFIKKLHSTESGISIGGSDLSIQLAVTSSNVDDYYKDWFIWNDLGSHSKILSYNGTTKTAILKNQLTTYTSYYELNNNRINNYLPIQYNNINKGLNEVFLVRLLYLTLPSSVLYCKYGGTLMDYPTVYVHIGNSPYSNSSGNILTNNKFPFEFAVPVDDGGVITNVPHYILTNCYMEIKLRLNLSDVLYFSVYFDDGEILTFLTDNTSPLPPDPNLQVTASFSIIKDCDNILCSDYGNQKIMNFF